MPAFTLRLIAILSVVVASVGARAQSAQGGDALDRLAFGREFQQLLVDYNSLPPAPVRPSPAEIVSWQDEIEPLLDALLPRFEQLARRSEAPADVLLLQALCHAKRASIYLNRRRMADEQIALARESGEPSAADLAERARLASQASDEYARIRDTLGRSLAAADELRRQREIQLVQGVVFAQSSIVLDRAIEVNQALGEKMDFDPLELRKLLDDAQELITGYLAATPRENGLEWVRGQFYLGVVEYRRSLKLRQPGEDYFTEVDPTRVAVFEQARQVFQELADPATVNGILQPIRDPAAFAESPAGRAFDASSFKLQAEYTVDFVARYYAASANLYLGLMAAIDPAYGASAADIQARIESARTFMDRAVSYDTVSTTGDPGSDADAPPASMETFSLTRGTIPSSRTSVISQLETALETPQRQPLNDLTLSFGAGYLYDTNPTLLGVNTLQAREISGKSDARFPAMMRFSYIADLDALDPGNEQLRKWQVLFEGRVSSVWGRDIPEFNQQFYGGAVNLRYELIGPEQANPLDGLYFHVRYDHDQVFLNNEAFLILNRVRPMLQAVFWEGLLDASLYFSYERRSYSEALGDWRFDRTGDYFSLGTEFRLDLGEWVEGEKLWTPEHNWGRWAPRVDDPAYRRPLRLHFGYEYLTASTLGDEFDYKSNLFSAGVVFPLPLGVDFAFGGLWEWQRYRQYSLLDRQRRPRGDLIQEYGFRFERPFYVTDYEADFEYVRPLNLRRVVLTPYLDLRFVINDSNVIDRLGQQVFEYNRIMYGAGIRVDLN